MHVFGLFSIPLYFYALQTSCKRKKPEPHYSRVQVTHSGSIQITRVSGLYQFLLSELWNAQLILIFSSVTSEDSLLLNGKMAGGGDHSHGGDFRTKVWSMTGGPYCRPVHWKRNTAIALVGIVLVCIPVALKSAELEVSTFIPFSPI